MHLLVDGLNKVKEGRMNNIDLFGQGWNRAAGPWLTHCGVYRIALIKTLAERTPMNNCNAGPMR
jgi:hypothetical protein